jgi:hypothetical protein
MSCILPCTHVSILQIQRLPQRSTDSAVTGPVEIGPIPMRALLRLEAVNLTSIVTYLHNTLCTCVGDAIHASR